MGRPRKDGTPAAKPSKKAKQSPTAAIPLIANLDPMPDSDGEPLESIGAAILDLGRRQAEIFLMVGVKHFPAGEVVSNCHVCRSAPVRWRAGFRILPVGREAYRALPTLDIISRECDCLNHTLAYGEFVYRASFFVAGFANVGIVIGAPAMTQVPLPDPEPNELPF